jgi:hypothetical protein
MNVRRFGVSGTKMKALNSDGIPQFFSVFLQKIVEGLGDS